MGKEDIWDHIIKFVAFPFAGVVFCLGCVADGVTDLLNEWSR